MKHNNKAEFVWILAFKFTNAVYIQMCFLVMQLDFYSGSIRIYTALFQSPDL